MRVHVIGAGLAGLAAALEASRHAAVSLYEAAPQAGGRCRSFRDDKLEREIDNGGHVVMGANDAAFDFLDEVGGRDAMIEVAPAAFPFIDLASGAAWVLRPNAGPVPWWVLARDRRVPGTRTWNYVAALRLLFAGPGAVCADALDPTAAIYERLWDPLITAVMNANPRQAAARPLARMLKRTFFAGEGACRPWVARAGLSHAFAEPALKTLAARGVAYHGEHRLTRIGFGDRAVTRLSFTSRDVELGAGDKVILAVPPAVASGLVANLAVPEGANAIVNCHFRLDAPARLPGGLPLLGLVGGTAQWLIVHDDIVSVTVSAADSIVDQPAESLIALLWTDVARALRLDPGTPPPARLIKEKRATFAQIPGNEPRRPGTETAWENMLLAGDWTLRGWPATIEAAIRSGRLAGRKASGQS